MCALRTVGMANMRYFASLWYQQSWYARFAYRRRSRHNLQASSFVRFNVHFISKNNNLKHSFQTTKS